MGVFLWFVETHVCLSVRYESVEMRGEVGEAPLGFLSIPQICLRGGGFWVSPLSSSLLFFSTLNIRGFSRRPSHPHQLRQLAPVPAANVYFPLLLIRNEARHRQKLWRGAAEEEEEEEEGDGASEGVSHGADGQRGATR